ncbi:TetR/AcrR family transcriptional regulator [Aquincola sp. MAHUQ-54]|uniref:TetR/AcrR family transcriptional regulator n=1 Tax=Aquincola agrisoli TaxID=3119538 RepID=A0AAW9Q7V0_9BURK
MSEQSRRPPAPRTRGPSPDKTARTRTLIVEAALDVFLARGFAQATMADVARQSGLAKGTPYHYFASKEALFEGVVQDLVVGALFHEQPPAFLEDETLEAFFRRTLLPLIRGIEQSRRVAVMRLVMTEGMRFPALADVYRREVFAPMNAHIRKVARQAVARGEQRAAVLARHPHLLMAPVWMGAIHNTLLRCTPEASIGRLFEEQLHALLGAGPR